MREVYKNPLLYYLLIPMLVGLWPLLVWGVYLPQSKRDLKVDGSLCVEGQTQVIAILDIDRGRLDPDKGPVTTQFEFSDAVTQAANLCKIPPSSCTLNKGSPSTSEGRKRQDARIKLIGVGIIQAAKFLHSMQSTWVTLQCQNVKLQRKKGMPDQWDVDFRFIYYY